MFQIAQTVVGLAVAGVLLGGCFFGPSVAEAVILLALLALFGLMAWLTRRKGGKWGRGRR